MTASHSIDDMPDPVLWEHRCSDGVGGCTAISNIYLTALIEMLDEVSRTKYWREQVGYLVDVARQDGYRVKDNHLEIFDSPGRSSSSSQ